VVGFRVVVGLVYSIKLAGLFCVCAWMSQPLVSLVVNLGTAGQLLKIMRLCYKLNDVH